MKTSTKIVAGTAVVGAGGLVAWLIFRKKPVTETPVEAPATTPVAPDVPMPPLPPLPPPPPVDEAPVGGCAPGEKREDTPTGYRCLRMAGALRGASVSLGHITMGPMGQSKEIPDYRGMIPRPWLNPLNRRG